jgi:hypothetical protein
MVIKAVNGKFPSIPEDCYVAENATIVGDVSFGNSCSVWFNAVIRGDVNFIKIGNEPCKLNGYVNANFTLNKLISCWDKSLYYFGVEKRDHDFVWFIEDDVYFYNEKIPEPAPSLAYQTKYEKGEFLKL